MRHVLCAGFVCGDLVLNPVDSLPPAEGNLFVQHAGLAIGGCAANAAVGFARLLAPQGGRVAVAGRIGSSPLGIGPDPLGRLLHDALSAAGVDTDPLLVTPGAATAINTALVTSSGERSFFVYPGACDYLGPDDLPDSLLRRFDHLHLAAIGALPGLAGEAGAGVAARARNLGLSVSLDITLNPPRNPVADVLPLLAHVDLFLPNLAEAQAVLGPGDVGALLDRSLAHGVALVGVKLGAAGCWLATASQRLHVPAYPIAVVDTVGAGDAWGAAAVYAWRRGRPLVEMGRFANAAGALCALQPGATAGLAEAAAVARYAGLAGADCA